MAVIAPGKTPRGPSDRVKTDRKDAELLARLLLAYVDALACVDAITARKAALAERLSQLASDERW